jgi:hypothetical protein
MLLYDFINVFIFIELAASEYLKDLFAERSNSYSSEDIC